MVEQKFSKLQVVGSGPTSRSKIKMNDSAIKLKQLMSDMSEDIWAAGWLVDLEFILWDVMTTGKHESEFLSTTYANEKYGWSIPFEQIENLKQLSTLANGWWMWDDVEHHTKFVSLEKWKTIVNAQILK